MAPRLADPFDLALHFDRSAIDPLFNGNPTKNRRRAGDISVRGANNHVAREAVESTRRASPSTAGAEFPVVFARIRVLRVIVAIAIWPTARIS
jgi:hypothetical protein